MSIYAGAKAPESLEVTISSSDPELDLNDADSVDLRIISRAPVVVWSASVIEKTINRVRARYTFEATGLDVPSAEYLKIAAEVVLDNGDRIRCVPMAVSVVTM